MTPDGGTVFTGSDAMKAQAERILIESRLLIKRRIGGDILAHCRGTQDLTYVCGFDPEAAAWFCSCMRSRLRGSCAHLEALWKVTGIGELREATSTSRA